MIGLCFDPIEFRNKSLLANKLERARGGVFSNSDHYFIDFVLFEA